MNSDTCLFTQDGGWYIKGSGAPWRGPTSSFSSSSSQLQTTTRGSVPQKSTPKYKRLTLKEFQLLKSTNSKKTTTKSTGVRFSTLSTTFTTDSGRKPSLSQSLDLRNSHETAFSKTFVQAPHQHSKTSSFA